MLDWVIQNSKWIFSGIGVLIVSVFVGYFAKRKKEVHQTQKSGKNCTNIQSTGDVHIDINKEKESDETEKW